MENLLYPQTVIRTSSKNKVLTTLWILGTLAALPLIPAVTNSLQQQIAHEPPTTPDRLVVTTVVGPHGYTNIVSFRGKDVIWISGAKGNEYIHVWAYLRYLPYFGEDMSVDNATGHFLWVYENGVLTYFRGIYNNATIFGGGDVMNMIEMVIQ